MNDEFISRLLNNTTNCELPIKKNATSKYILFVQTCKNQIQTNKFIRYIKSTVTTDLQTTFYSCQKKLNGYYLALTVAETCNSTFNSGNMELTKIQSYPCTLLIVRKY